MRGWEEWDREGEGERGEDLDERLGGKGGWDRIEKKGGSRGEGERGDK